MKTPTVPEKVIENQILTYLWFKKIFAWKNTSGGYFDTKLGAFKKQRSKFAINGTSDILGILPGGRMLAIEVKSKTGKASQEQHDFINKINLSGGLAFIARSIDDVDQNLFNKKEV